MSCNLQCESIAKFVISDCPVVDNFPDTAEFMFMAREKVLLKERDLLLAQCASWVDKEQVAEVTHVMESACVVVEKQKCN